MPNALADPWDNPWDRESRRLLFFAGADVWRHGHFVHGGLLWSPRGVDADGFTFKLLVNGGQYRYESDTLGGAEVTGRKLASFLAPGWRFRRGALTLTLFAGLDLQNHALSPDDPGAKLNGSYAGARVAAEIWYQPTPETFIAADASISTIGGDYSARGALGWRVAGAFYLGPEAQALQSNDYSQFRFGVHATALKIGDAEWSAAAGWAVDTDDRSGAYGRIGVLVRK